MTARMASPQNVRGRRPTRSMRNHWEGECSQHERHYKVPDKGAYGCHVPSHTKDLLDDTESEGGLGGVPTELDEVGEVSRDKVDAAEGLYSKGHGGDNGTSEIGFPEAVGGPEPQ